MAVKPVPEGYHTITPYLVVRGAGECIEFLKKAFGAEETFRMPRPGGKVGHAELRFSDSVLMIADESDEAPARQAGIHLYVPDVDAVYKRAVGAGAKGQRPPADQFYGDRMGVVGDRWGNVWSIGTHKEDVPPDEMQRRMTAQKG
jgi:PhnB protein